MRARFSYIAPRRQTRPALLRAVVVMALAVASVAFTSFMLRWLRILCAARNVILMIGDGMGSAQVEAGRQRAASVGRRLAMESMPVQSLVTTTSISGGITDSAAARPWQPAAKQSTGAWGRRGRESSAQHRRICQDDRWADRACN